MRIKKFNQKLTPQQSLGMVSAISADGEAKSTDLLKLSIGQVVEVKGVKYLITESYTYHELNKKGQRKKYTWREYQLTNPMTGDIVYLEVEKDDYLQAYLTVGQLRKSAISSGLNHLDEVTVNGVDYELEEECYVECVTDSTGEGERYMSYDYENARSETLAIEDWDGSIEVYPYEEIELTDIIVIR